MVKPFTFRALWRDHATAMDLAYLLPVVEVARKYDGSANAAPAIPTGDADNWLRARLRPAKDTIWGGRLQQPSVSP